MGQALELVVGLPRSRPGLTTTPVRPVLGPSRARLVPVPGVELPWVHPASEMPILGQMVYPGGMFKTGYLPDSFDERDRPAHALLSLGQIAGGRVSAESEEAPSLEAFMGPVLNQRNAGSCVPHGLAKAIQMHWTIEGVQNAPLPNILALYWESRKSHGAEETDSGTHPRLSMEALRSYGFCLESEYPYDDTKVLEPVPPRVYRASYDQMRQIEYYRMSDDPDQRLAQMKQAIQQFRPFNVAIPVNEKFRKIRDLTPYCYDGGLLGYHYVTPIGYNVDGLLVLNSWGANWGQGGLFRLSWKTALDSGLCTDPYVITFAPRVLPLD